MTQHSLGPWETDRAARGGIGVYTRQGATVCKVAQWHGSLGQTTTEANAALIAAAPDLLNMCERLLGFAHHYADASALLAGEGMLASAKALIAKAKGRAA